MAPNPGKILFLLLLQPALIVAACGAAPGATSTNGTCELHKNETIVIYPSIAYQRAPGKPWTLEIHGILYEPEARGAALEILYGTLKLRGVNMSPGEHAVFEERARLFMADHKSRRKVVLRVGDHVVTAAKTRSDGTFRRDIELSETEVLAPGLRVAAVLPNGDPRSFRGDINVLGPTGMTVISDIDDTIKDTHVGDRNRMLRSTFLESFLPTEGMAEVFRRWQQPGGAQFCYVSASPWQLYQPLTAFLAEHRFPTGMVCLQNFRLKDRSGLSVFESPAKYKRTAIEPMLKKWPQRRFVLVGDSGQQDPETFGELARGYPRQILGIYIRNVTAEAPRAQRFQKAFKGLRPNLWLVFTRPAEVPRKLPQPD